MKANISLTTRLNILITISLIAIIVTVSLFTEYRLTQIIDENQKDIYKEKISSICTALERKNNRLKLTGMTDAYLEDFQLQFLDEFRDLYYKSKYQNVYPFIINNNGDIIIHPVLQYGDSSISNTEYIKKALQTKNGDLYYTYSNGVKKWMLFRTFHEWGWIIGYAIPIKEKYANVNRFEIVIIQILILVSIVALVIITLLVKKQLHPISLLTAASAEISSGNLEYEIAVSGVGEIETLTENFRAMQGSIKKTIEDLANSEESLRITMNSIGDGVISTNVNGEVVQINPIAEKLTGWSSSEAVGKSLELVFQVTSPKSNSIFDTIDKVFKSGESANLAEYSILTDRNGDTCRIADSAAPIRNDIGSVVGVVLVFRDITEEFKLKEMLYQSQKMDAIGQLAGGVAHDFNNMLGGILGAADLLYENIKDEESLELLKLITSASESAAGLTKKLLYFSRKGKIESTPVSVHSAINEAKSILQRSINKNITIVTEFNGESNYVVGDMSQLQNIFLNLGINASHAMEDSGGTLIYRTSTVDINEAYCSAVPFDITPGEYLQVEVEDTGTGIEITNLNKIFEPFFTTKEQGKGTGLGLSAVYGTVQQHHGSITVYSEIGKGTTFRILLPLTKIEAKIIQSANKPSLGNGTILVIDDEHIIRTMACHMLEKLGYSVILAEDGIDGLEKYKENAEKIDMIIIDVIMPKMDGRNCFLELIKINPSVKVALSSGFTKNADIESLRELGLCGFIHKPYRMIELSKLVSNILSGNNLRG